MHIPFYHLGLFYTFSEPGYTRAEWAEWASSTTDATLGAKVKQKFHYLELEWFRHIKVLTRWKCFTKNNEMYHALWIK